MGWGASQLHDADFLGRACYWCRLAVEWLRAHAEGPGAEGRFRLVPAGLVKAMADVWVLASRHRASEVLPGLMAADAAWFCVQLLGRPSLVTSPVVQDKLLAVLDSFVLTADAASDPASGQPPHHAGGGGGGPGSPVYFGPGRGLAGAVMDNAHIRAEAAPSLLRLYANCHAVAGLDVVRRRRLCLFSIH